ISVNTSNVPGIVAAGPRGNTSSIDLRGLGQSQTLVLVDGRRAADHSILGGQLQPDLNSIPLSQIERIEVLPASASGIYGGSATGGVVNVVLRHNYSGVHTSLTYDNPVKSSAARSRVDISAGTGTPDGKTSLLVSASYSDFNALLARDRD